jgi:predicted aspartyl protease
MTIPYDASYEPSALVIPAVLAGVVRSRPQVRLSALIDTGSDIIAVPETAVTRLRLYAVGRIEVEGVHAHVETVEIYTVQLSIADLRIREMEVIPTKQPFVILGRDWLETYYLLLNGPEQTFLLSETPLLETA